MSVIMKGLKLEEMNKVSGGDLHSHMMDFGERQYYQELLLQVRRRRRERAGHAADEGL